MDLWTQIADAMAVVWRVYRAELQRDPDPDCAGWVAEVATGRMTEAQMVETVRQTDEWKTLHQIGPTPEPERPPEPEPTEPEPTEPPTPEPAPVGRTGLVRLDGRAMTDDGGPWLALGASLFWAVRGARTEPERLRANMRWLKAHGIDFIRVIAETTDWAEDRRTDPRWPDYADCLRRTRDIAAEEGLRIAWTIFGGNRLARDAQWACAHLVRAVCAERPGLVQYVEVSNESQGLQAAGSIDANEVAGWFRAGGFVTAITSADHATSGVYQAGPANAATVHFERRLGDNGWRPVRQPWGYPGEYGSGLPAAFISGEPIGPGSSVASETDPEKLAMNAVHTWLCGGCAHIVHYGAGIYGVENDHPVGGHRPANCWEQLGLEAALARIAYYRAQLPADLPNWRRTRHGMADHPFTFAPDAATVVGDTALMNMRGCVRAYAAYRDGRYVCAVIGIMDEITLVPQHADGGVLTLTEAVGPTRLWMGRYQ